VSCWGLCDGEGVALCLDAAEYRYRFLLYIHAPASPQLKLWAVSGGVLRFVRWRESCVVFGSSGVQALMNGIYTVFALSHS